MRNKYRGKHIETGEWIYGYLIGDDAIVGKLVDWDDEYFCTEFWYKVDPDTVGAYSNIKDCENTELYAGDLLEHFLHPNVIVELAWGITGWHLISEENDYDWSEWSPNLMTKVANKHDNPELLEV